MPLEMLMTSEMFQESPKGLVAWTQVNEVRLKSAEEG